MSLPVKHTVDPEAYSTLNTVDLRNSFLIDSLFQPERAVLVSCEVDRAIVGGIMPGTKPVPLSGSKKDLGTDEFAERREIGVINVGGKGTIEAGGKSYTLEHEDALYIGRGTRTIQFASADPSKPAAFYMISYPAHTAFPMKLIRRDDADRVDLGTPAQANSRTIRKYILPGKVESCQLVMGMTTLAEGSVWNTMPPHTHIRRSEVYLYYNLPPDGAVFHFMGTPSQTRHLVMRDRQAVISPSWSIHMGVGSKSYSFVWAMGGENQEFDDMDAVPVKSIM